MTLLAKVDKNGNLKEYPISMPTVRVENKDWSFPDEVEVETINDLGYQVVERVEQPKADVVEEGIPVFFGGVWKQSWLARPYNQEERDNLLFAKKAVLVDQIEVRLLSALDVGFEFDFGTESTPDICHVQLRVADRSSITGCGLKADRLIAAGVTAAMMPFRTYENENKLCTPQQLKTLSDQAYDAYLVYLKVVWDLKDSVKAALTIEDLPTIPEKIELPVGWQTMLAP